jgi:hypothetical protein
MYLVVRSLKHNNTKIVSNSIFNPNIRNMTFSKVIF